MGITSGRTIKPRRAESSKPTTRGSFVSALVARHARQAREPDYISTEEIDARPDIIPVCERDSGSSRWMYWRARPIGFAMQHAWLSSPMTGSFDRNDREERGGQEIEFSSLPPGFFTFSIFAYPSFLPPFFFYVAYTTATRTVSSIVLSYGDCDRLDSRTFGVIITAIYRIITCSDLICRTRGSCAL